MFNKRLIPIITPIIIYLFSQAFLWQPNLFFPGLALGSLVIILSVRYAMTKHQEDWLLFVSAPVLFWLGFSGYAAIIVNHWLIQSVFLLELWFIFVYLRDLYYYSNQSEAEWSPRLDNLFMAGGFLTIFATAAVFFALPSFLTLPVGLSFLALLLILGLSLSQFFANKKEHWRHSFPVFAVALLSLVELAGVLSLLPLNFNVLALFLAFIYYFGLTVIRLYHSGSLNRRAIKLPLWLSALALLALLLTARWL